jgi:hypothetical protein
VAGDVIIGLDSVIQQSRNFKHLILVTKLVSRLNFRTSWLGDNMKDLLKTLIHQSKGMGLQLPNLTRFRGYGKATSVIAVAALQIHVFGRAISATMENGASAMFVWQHIIPAPIPCCRLLTKILLQALLSIFKPWILLPTRCI